nr:hypothetical protein [uncultured Fluviicola sp.]
MPKLIFLLFLIPGFYIPVFAQKNSKANLHWVEFRKNDYQIKYPDTWTLDSTGKTPADIIISSPLDSPEDQFKENLNFMVQDLSGLNFDLDNFTALSLQQVQNYLQDSELIESERMKKSELECQHLIYTAKRGKITLRFEQYFWIINEKAYILSFTGESDQFELYKDTSEFILESFVIK